MLDSWFIPSTRNIWCILSTIHVNLKVVGVARHIISSVITQFKFWHFHIDIYQVSKYFTKTDILRDQPDICIFSKATNFRKSIRYSRKAPLKHFKTNYQIRAIYTHLRNIDFSCSNYCDHFYICIHHFRDFSGLQYMHLIISVKEDTQSSFPV